MDYGTNSFAPLFFLIASNGSDTGIAINKENSSFYCLPLIGMSNESAKYLCDDFNELLNFEFEL